MSIVTEIV